MSRNRTRNFFLLLVTLGLIILTSLALDAAGPEESDMSLPAQNITRQAPDIEAMQPAQFETATFGMG